MIRLRLPAYGLMLLACLSLNVKAQQTDTTTGLIMAAGWQTVRSNCISCHSAQLITSNSGSRAVWKSRLLWMQESQGMPQLAPATEKTILTYLSTHYGHKEATRRAALISTLLPVNPYPVLDR